MSDITEFRGEYRFLSNFYPAAIDFGDWRFPTAEHAFQAAKSADPLDWATIKNLQTPGEAKKAGRYVTLRPDWDAVKVDVMTEIVRVKFTDPLLKAKLLATGTRELIEGNTWNDRFWGVCNGRGQNHLGKILMKIREEIG